MYLTSRAVTLPVILFLMSTALAVGQTSTTTQSQSINGVGTVSWSATVTTNNCLGQQYIFYSFTGFSLQSLTGSVISLYTGTVGPYFQGPAQPDIECHYTGNPPPATPLVLTSATESNYGLTVTIQPEQISNVTLTANSAIRPKFVVLSVVYAPPGDSNGSASVGAQNLVNYGTSTQLGTSTTLTNTIKQGVGFSVTTSFGINIPTPIASFSSTNTTTSSTTFSQEQDSTQSIAVTKLSTFGSIENAPPAPGLNHDFDTIFVWLNPVFPVSIVNGVLTWNGYQYDPNDQNSPNDMEIVQLTVGQLKGIQTIPEQTIGFLARSWSPTGGLTPADFATILARDPFANGGTTIDPARFDPVSGANIPYSPAPQGGNPSTKTVNLTYQTTSASGATAIDTYDTSYIVDNNIGASFGAQVSVDLKSTTTLTLTNKYDYSNSTTTGQSASLSITAPNASDNYTGPTAFNVYKDNVYGTFLFVPAPSPQHFIPITPCRVVDTRNANGPYGGPILPAGTTRNFTPAGTCNIPSSASAYSLNFTVVPPGGISYLTVWPTGQSQPVASLLNSDGRIKANAAIVPAGTAGAISVFTTDVTHLVIDVNGYFVPDGVNPAVETAFNPVTPCRVLDTRTSVGPFGGPSLVGGAIRTLPVLSSPCNIPSNATAYSMNFTSIPHGGLGYLTTWPTGVSQPVVSTLNSFTGAVTANAAIVPAGSGGNISIYVTDTSDLAIDINGYFAPPQFGALSLYNIPTCRVLDTRTGAGTPVSGTLPVTVSTSSCVFGASSVKAYVFNVTAVPIQSLGFLSVLPDGAAPTTSTLNANDLAITSNMAIVPSPTGVIDVYTPNSLAHAILDIAGFFAP